MTTSTKPLCQCYKSLRELSVPCPLPAIQPDYIYCGKHKTCHMDKKMVGKKHESVNVLPSRMAEPIKKIAQKVEIFDINSSIVEILKHYFGRVGIDQQSTEYLSDLLRKLCDSMMYKINSSKDVQSVVNQMFIGLLVKQGNKMAVEIIENGGKGLYVPSNFIKQLYPKNLSDKDYIYTASMLQYIISEILELAGNSAENRHNTKIILDDIYRAIAGDSEIFRTLNSSISLPKDIIFYVEQEEIAKQARLIEAERERRGKVAQHAKEEGEKVERETKLKNAVQKDRVIIAVYYDEDGIISSDKHDMRVVCPNCGCKDEETFGKYDWVELEWSTDDYTISPHVYCNMCGGLFVLCPDHIWTHNDELTFTEKAEQISSLNGLSEVEKQFVIEIEINGENMKIYKIPLSRIVGICNRDLMDYVPKNTKLREKNYEEMCSFINDLYSEKSQFSEKVEDEDEIRVMKKHNVKLRKEIHKQIEDWCHPHVEYDPNRSYDGEMDNLCDTYFMTVPVDSYNIYQPVVPYPKNFDTTWDGVLYYKCLSSTGKKFKTIHWGD